MTILSISQDVLVMLPAGSTGGSVKISYNGVTKGPVIASGDDRGRAVIVAGRLAKLTAPNGTSPLRLVGREAGGRVPARCTIRIYPEYPAGQTGPTSPITLTGLPTAHPDAPRIWMMDNIDDASGGMDIVLPSERLSLGVLRERATAAAERAEAVGAQAETILQELKTTQEGQKMYTPTKKRVITATHNLNGSGEAQAVFTLETSHARTDGADIRVYNSASELVPHVVTSAAPVTGGYRYVVSFMDTFTANESKAYVVKYGDPEARYATLTQEQLRATTRPDALVIGGMEAYHARITSVSGVADAEFLSAGDAPLITSERSSGTTAQALPDSGSVVWNGQTYSTLYWHADNGLMFQNTGSTISKDSRTPPSGLTDGLLYSHFNRSILSLRFSVTSDGYLWYIRHRGSIDSGDKYSDAVLRYINGGVWEYTLLRDKSTTQVESIAIVAAGTLKRLPFDPATAPLSIRISPQSVLTTAPSAEQAV